MTNAQAVQTEFWRTFDTILKEKGEPFKIIHEMSGNVKNWGAINKNKIWSKNMVAVSISARTKKIRIDIYVENQNTPIGKILNDNRANISRKISVPAQWLNGVKQENTLRLRYTLSIINLTYRQAIEMAWPTILEFIAVADEYGSKEFFDYPIVPRMSTNTIKPSTSTHMEEKLINVTHKKFGEGTIIAVADKLATITFKGGVTKSYSFPHEVLRKKLIVSDSELENLDIDEKINIIYERYCKK